MYNKKVMKIKSKILILSLSSFIIASCVETPLVSEDTFSTQSGNTTSSNTTDDNNSGTSTPGSNNNEPAPSSDDTGPDNPGTDNPSTDNPGTDNPGTDDTGGNEGETGGQPDDTGGGGNDETGGKEEEYDLNNPVSLNVHNLTLYVNGTYQLNTQNKNNLPLFYTSDISDYVQVSSTGLITAKEICKTKVTVRDSIGNSDYCIVEVKQNPNFKFNVNYLDLFVGETATITTNVSNTTYSSEDESIATISSSGEIRAVSAGVVNLVARKDNSIDKCQLRVVLQNHSMFEFELNSSGTYTVKGFSSTVSNEDKKNIIIPYKYNDKPVTAISGSAFWDYKTNTKAEKLVLPNSIKSIASSAFMGRGFTQIGTLYLPNELESIDRFGFENGSFEYIYFPRKEFTISDCAFQNCHSLKKIYLHENIIMTKDPFHDCYGTGGGIGITHIYLEEGIKETPQDFCVSLHELEYINIPSSVTKIKSYMFYMMNYASFGIRKLVIPKNVEQITSRLYAFNNNDDSLPNPPMKLLCEKEEIPTAYSSSNNDSYYIYSKTSPTDNGKFWHYVNNEPTIW